MDTRSLLEEWARPPIAMDPPALIEIQRDAWIRAGLLDHAENRRFPGSGLFEFPPEIVYSILRMLAMGTTQGALALERDHTGSMYQERVTMPFIRAARRRLEPVVSELAPTLVGQRVRCATAPLASIYPRARFIGDECCVIFDSGMLFLYLIAINAFWAIGAQLGRDGESLSPKDVICKSTPLGLIAADRELHALAECLLNAVTQNWPVPPTVPSFEALESHRGAALMVADIYTFTLAHELAHIELGHFGGPAADGEAAARRETDADRMALHWTLASYGNPTDTMHCYVSALVLFEIMRLVYRTVNYLAFRVDYREMPPPSLLRLYFPEPMNDHPHPVIRLEALQMHLNKAHPELSARTRHLQNCAHTFFNAVWLAIELRLAGGSGTPSRLWRVVVDQHRLAHGSS